MLVDPFIQIQDAFLYLKKITLLVLAANKVELLSYSESAAFPCIKILNTRVLAQQSSLQRYLKKVPFAVRHVKPSACRTIDKAVL